MRRKGSIVIAWVRRCPGSAGPQPSVREQEEPADGVHHGVGRVVPQSSVVQVADVELEVGPLEPDQRVQASPANGLLTRRARHLVVVTAN